MEIAQLQTEGLLLNDSIYFGTIGETTVQLLRLQGKLVFVMPQLQPGSYTLKLALAGQEFQPSFVMSAPASIDAIVSIQQLNQQINATQTMVSAFADTLPAAEKALWIAEMQGLQAWQDTLLQRFNNLPIDQRQNAVAILAANAWWLDEINNAVVELNTFTRSFKSQSTVEDHEAKMEKAMANFIAAKAKVVSHLPKITMLALAGAGVGSTIPVLGTIGGGIIGAGLGVIKYWSSFSDLKTSLVDLLTTSFIPFENMVPVNKSQSFISLVSNVPAEFKIIMTYRSPYASDNNSAVPMVAELVAGLKEIRNAWDAISRYLPFSDNPSRLVTDYPAYRTRNWDAHSKYVVLDDFDPGNYEIKQLSKQDGFIIINILNNDGVNIYPTCRATYNYPRLGTVVDYLGFSVSVGATNTCPATVTDIEGNEYAVGRIGGQCWMLENLRSSRYRNGSPIQQFPVDSFFTKSSNGTPGWSYYDDNASNNVPYGKLYNGYVLDNGVCPTGWHVPSLFEFRSLVDSLGGNLVAGDKMKSTTLWTGSATSATNSSGFNAYPAGYVAFDTSNVMGKETQYWTTTEPNFPNGDETFAVFLLSNSSGVGVPTMAANNGQEWNIYGLSIRCVKD